MSNILIFGGTFDPIHSGHLFAAIAVQDYFKFDRFIFLPCKIPVLKNEAHASSNERLDMLHLALSEHKKYSFEVDEREINRESPSYTVVTLENFRQELGESISITIMMGADSFKDLPKWHKWSSILSLANILVIYRPHYKAVIASLIPHETNDKTHFIQSPHGLIYHFDAGYYDFSSSSIREQFAKGINPISILPASVADYINHRKLYCY